MSGNPTNQEFVGPPSKRKSEGDLKSQKLHPRVCSYDERLNRSGGNGGNSGHCQLGWIHNIPRSCFDTRGYDWPVSWAFETGVIREEISRPASVVPALVYSRNWSSLRLARDWIHNSPTDCVPATEIVNGISDSTSPVTRLIRQVELNR